MAPKLSKLPGLARAIDIAHRSHAPGKHPKTITFEGKTYKLGGHQLKQSSESHELEQRLAKRDKW